MLAVDVEPGLAPAYHGEDSFVDTHRALVEAGFWLGSASRWRRSPATGHTGALGVALEPYAVANAVRRSPVYCEARYLRTPEALAQAGAAKRQYALLWAIALLDRQPGYALDLVVAYERAFGADPLSAALRAEPLHQIKRLGRRQLQAQARRLLNAALPAGLRRAIKGRLL